MNFGEPGRGHQGDWTLSIDESREIFRARQRIVAALGLAPGMAIADVGAGTGLFVGPFARKVGDGGSVYAVELSPKFVAHLAERVKREGLAQAGMEGLAFLRQRQGQTTAFKEARPEETFQIADLMADRGLGNGQLLCRAGEALVTGNRLKSAQSVQRGQQVSTP